MEVCQIPPVLHRVLHDGGHSDRIDLREGEREVPQITEPIDRFDSHIQGVVTVISLLIERRVSELDMSACERENVPCRVG